MFPDTILGQTLGVVWYMALAFISIIIAIWPGIIAKSKGHSFWLWFLISIPFWWISFFLVIFYLKDDSAQTPPSAA